MSDSVLIQTLTGKRGYPYSPLEKGELVKIPIVTQGVER